MDKNVYGDSLAAINLADMVNKHPQRKIIMRKVGRLLETFFQRTNEIELIKSRGTIEHIYIMLINDIKNNPINFPSNDLIGDDFKELEMLEERIQTHVINVVQGRFKAWKHGERDSIARSEVVEHSRIFRTVGGLTVIHRDMEVGTTRFKKRMK